jgi:hypothetical protein
MRELVEFLAFLIVKGATLFFVVCMFCAVISLVRGESK